MDFDEERIAGLVRANKRLSREVSRLGGLFNAVKEGIIVADGDGEIKYANAAAKSIFGLSKGAHASDVSKILPEIDPIALRAASDGTAARREFEITYPERRFIRVYIAPFGEEGEGSAALVVTDITQEKLSTEELIESEKIASVLKLASGVAHELGNPLNSIGIHLQLASRRLRSMPPSQDREKLSAAVDVCSAEVSRLDAIIKNFLKALRPARPNLAEINPIAPLVETVSFLRDELQDIGIEVEFETNPSLPSMMGDSDMLKQLYFNIIKNSMEAMDGGGLIRIKTSFGDSDVTISISDTGCGIDQDEITRIFDPYFTTKTNGHGLGMMIAGEIVKSHGGTIGVKSKKNEGATILLTFPRKEKRIREIEAH